MTQLTPIQTGFYNSIKNSFIKQIDEKTFVKEINFAIQALKKNTYLQNCSQESILQSVLNVSQTGLSLNPVLNLAYLVPHRGKCVLYPSYQGLCKLATDTGSVKSISCQLIYQGDEVDFDLASEQKIKKHIPAFLKGNQQGNILGGYSIALLDNGSKHIEYMTEKQLTDVREYSESYKAFKLGKVKSCVWDDNPFEMRRKTIVKRHFKYLPKTHVSENLVKALELDNSEYDFPASFEQGNMIESLLLTSTIPHEVERQIHDTLYKGEFTKKRAEECIQYLQQNQQDPIQSGNGNYTQGDIQNKLTEVMQDPKK